MKYTVVLAIAFTIFAFGCKKKDNSTPQEETSSTTTTGGTAVTVDVNSTSQASFTLDGVNKSYVANNSTIFEGSGASSAGTGASSYDADIDDGNSIAYITITKGTLSYSGSNPTDANFKAFFPVASIPYSSNAVNGVSITIYDNGTYWSTSQGTANQTGSTFNIVQVKDNPDLSGTYYLKFKATFSCKVYDGSGNSKTITNGVFVGNFGNI